VQATRDWLQAQGVQPGDAVMIQGANRPEWLFVDWALLALGAISVPIYMGSPEEEVLYIHQETNAKWMISDELPSGVVGCSWKTLQEGFTSLLNQSTHALTCPFVPEDCVTIIYTSGTQGRPKGVMHSLHNLSEGFHRAQERGRFSSRDRILSYLPLSHIAERALVGLGALYEGVQIVFLNRVELLAKALPLVRPTVFFTVPRVWELFRTRVEKELSSPLAQRRIAAIPFFLRPWLVGRMVRKKLGLDRARFCFSGAAKLYPDTSKALAQWGIVVHEAYGLTETMAISTLSEMGRPLAGSCGKPYSDVQIKIAPDGEILLKAPFHFLGYYKQKELTDEVIQDGWFATGDVGHVDAQGNLHITDRKKSLFKTSGGKYVAPLVAESLLKQCALVKEAVVFGENKDYCVALVQVDRAEWSMATLVVHLKRLNRKLAAHEQIKKVGVVAEDWSIQSGDVTPSFKLKRHRILAKYKNCIEWLYESQVEIVELAALADEAEPVPAKGVSGSC
jgi:long-chain acyl-CoA synthetase